MHQPIGEQGAYLRSVVRGYFRYHGVPMNGPALDVFLRAVVRHWRHVLQRRSQTHRITEARMATLVKLWLPQPRICHPYPWVRIAL